jgi:hypothetical protein
MNRPTLFVLLRLIMNTPFETNCKSIFQPNAMKLCKITAQRTIETPDLVKLYIDC